MIFESFSFRASLEFLMFCVLKQWSTDISVRMANIIAQNRHLKLLTTAIRLFCAAIFNGRERHGRRCRWLMVEACLYSTPSIFLNAACRCQCRALAWAPAARAPCLFGSRWMGRRVIAKRRRDLRYHHGIIGQGESDNHQGLSGAHMSHCLPG